MKRLTSAEVAEIRARRASGEKLLSIAVSLGVSEMTVSYAARGITHPVCPRPRAPRNRPVEVAILTTLRSRPDGCRIVQLARALYGDISQPFRARVSTNIHGLKCRGLVRRVRSGVWALTEAA